MKIVIRQDIPLPVILDPSWPAQRTVLGWLGQAGFLVRCGQFLLVIDPYLSDSLAVKYRGRALPHARLMPPPVAPDEIAPLDCVLCTHAHTDHMDPDTLSVLAAVNPDCRFVVPRAVLQTALQRGVPLTRAIALNAGEEVELTAGIVVRAVASAHEELQCDEHGNHSFLGYVIRLQDATIYHSGDCVPYAGLADALVPHRIHLAMLPVNGRGAIRRSHGIPGNFNYDEAVQLCREAQIGSMIACHFGMFDFNSVDVAWLDRQIANTPATLHCIRAKIGETCELN